MLAPSALQPLPAFHSARLQQRRVAQFGRSNGDEIDMLSLDHSQRRGAHVEGRNLDVGGLNDEDGLHAFILS